MIGGDAGVGIPLAAIRAAIAGFVAFVLLCSSLGCTNDNPPPGSGSSDSGSPTATAKSSAGKKPAIVQTALGPPPKILTAAELDEGWITLFDGQTLFGWHPEADAKWQANPTEHTIDADGTPGALLTTTEFGACEVSLEYRTKPQCIASILLAAGSGPRDPSANCYEVCIANEKAKTPTGSLIGRQNADHANAKPDWNHLQIRLANNTITITLNQQTVLEYTDPQPRARGHIGLRCRQGTLQLRRIKLKPLGLQTIFNGRDLSGWKTYPEMTSVFSVAKDGTLHVENGPGQLETEQAYGDFVLQLECMTHAPNLNSGIFFRCIPGEKMNGYESQIQNECKDGDRTRPADCGTGGIFRRQAARRVVANDLEWFHKTIIATGPHIAVWVDGYQVTDWTDTRTPHQNPRRGLRLEPGTIMIQGHDPTTNISFRNLRAVELPKRP